MKARIIAYSVEYELWLFGLCKPRYTFKPKKRIKAESSMHHTYMYLGRRRRTY